MTSKPPVPPSSRDPNRSIAESNAEGILQHAVDQLVIERDELRAEVEHLRNQLVGADETIHSLEGWRDSAEAEVERQRWIINTATDEQVRLRAEVERLKAACIGDCENRLIEALDEQLGLREEIERLRAFVGRVVGAYAVDEWIAAEGQRLLDHAKE